MAELGYLFVDFAFLDAGEAMSADPEDQDRAPRRSIAKEHSPPSACALSLRNRGRSHLFLMPASPPADRRAAAPHAGKKNLSDFSLSENLLSARNFHRVSPTPTIVPLVLCVRAAVEGRTGRDRQPPWRYAFKTGHCLSPAWAISLPVQLRAVDS